MQRCCCRLGLVGRQQCQKGHPAKQVQSTRVLARPAPEQQLSTPGQVAQSDWKETALLVTQVCVHCVCIRALCSSTAGCTRAGKEMRAAWAGERSAPPAASHGLASSGSSAKARVSYVLASSAGRSPWGQGASQIVSATLHS